MAEATMPAAEAVAAGAHDDERNSYEFAFHILPTVAEGEVPGVFEELKALIQKNDGEIFDEEAPERIELAYEVVMHLEGKNRRFTSAYFGWIRFRAAGSAIDEIGEAIAARNDILRHLIIKLTKKEEQHPFRYHEARKSHKQHVTIEEREVLTEATSEKKGAGKVSEAELDQSLEKLTGGDDLGEKEAPTDETPKKEETTEQPADDEEQRGS